MRSYDIDSRGESGSVRLYLRIAGRDYVQIVPACLPKLGRHRYNAPSSIPKTVAGGAPCGSRTNTSNSSAFEVSSKRRRGFPSETHVKRGDRVVHGGKELIEKLGRNDPCQCGSGRRFQALLHVERRVRWFRSRLLFSGRRRLAASMFYVRL
jgi:hypothetical protein